MTTKEHSFFLLTHEYRDMGRNIQITIYAKRDDGQIAKILIDNFRPMFFLPKETPEKFTILATERKSLPLKSMTGQSVDCCYFSTQKELLECSRLIKENHKIVFESDIKPVERYLMERNVKLIFTAKGSFQRQDNILIYHNPIIRGTSNDFDLSILSLDIETNAKTNEIYSIACYEDNQEIVFMSGSGQISTNIKYCESEKILLLEFFNYINKRDPDVLIGWNVVDFDLLVIQNRCNIHNIKFNIGRNATARIIKTKQGKIKTFAIVPGRVVLDAFIQTKNFSGKYDSYTLDNIASKVLGTNKTITSTGQDKINEINRQFKNDKLSLANYNINDARLTLLIFKKLQILQNAIERSKLSGQLLDKIGGSVASFDYLYLPKLHRKGYVANDLSDIPIKKTGISGGYVMESKAGFWENVLVLDFKSLYPTIIMTFKIDPLGKFLSKENPLHGPFDTVFSKTNNILPNVISELMTARAEAKKTNNQSLSQAIKILMNSFYGVLGSGGCRFFSPELASAITGAGQYILKTTAKQIKESTNFDIIYGDTDSIFVLLGPDHTHNAKNIGKQIVKDINAWLSSHIKYNFDAESALELEFETHFRHFFMPSIRGSLQGSKKRYCGAIETGNELKLIFKGLESARTDWTDLAKEIQYELIMRVFTKKDFQDYIIKIVDDTKKGLLDKKLIYRKQLRKPLDDYTDHVPPHVQAARKLKKLSSNKISYVITKGGPQPVENQTEQLDYDHYVNTQIAPIVQSIIEWKNMDFENIISGQQDLFG